MRLRLAGAALGLIVLVLLVRSCGGDSDLPGGVVAVPTPKGATGEAAKPFPDPFAWNEDQRDAFVERATAGLAHGLYAFSPGGVLASAARTARWRTRIEGASKAAGVRADTLEGLVFLESAGRDDAVTAAGTEGAVGLTQIVAGTATQLLGMQVDVKRSASLTRRISRAIRRLDLERAAQLRRLRARVDERYDPAKALAGMARYLAMARAKFGREDLAVESYHMGMGNLQGVLDAFGEGATDWPRAYFDSTPLRHPEAYAKLASFGDDSANYYWKVLAGESIMALYRRSPDELARTAELQTAKASAEEVLHPFAVTERYADPGALRAAWDDKEIVAFPTQTAVTGLVRDGRMGELAERLKVPPGLYRGLRPAALAMAMYIGAQVRAITGTQTALRVTSTVRDQRYQDLLVRTNREATRRYSLHTTGWAFDVARRYRSRAQALAFQFVLDRLQALNLIAWAREPGAIHITVSTDAESLLPLLKRLG